MFSSCNKLGFSEFATVCLHRNNDRLCKHYIHAEHPVFKAILWDSLACSIFRFILRAESHDVVFLSSRQSRAESKANPKEKAPSRSVSQSALPLLILISQNQIFRGNLVGSNRWSVFSPHYPILLQMGYYLECEKLNRRRAMGAVVPTLIVGELSSWSRDDLIDKHLCERISWP